MLPIIKSWPNTKDSTSNEDCYFLYEKCREYKPKKILEIGTLVGKSAYAMALGSDCEIHTIDKNRDRFVLHKGHEQIIRYPETTSIDFWKKGIGGFDFVFVDGWLKFEDCEKIFQHTLDNFWFLCHDYKFDDKGYEVVRRMLKESMTQDYNYDLSTGGECIALIKFGKT